MQDTFDWHIYERVAACFEIEAASMDVSVTPNASLLGSISGVRRQIDILVDARWEEGTERRIIFDAKRCKRKIDVKDVEAFEGMMRDVRASRGVIVCSNGWTKAARARADENIDFELMSAEEAEELDHAAIDPCPYCQTLKRKTKGDCVLGTGSSRSHWGDGRLSSLASAIHAEASHSGVGTAEKSWSCRTMKSTSAGASAPGMLKRTVLRPCLWSRLKMGKCHSTAAQFVRTKPINSL